MWRMRGLRIVLLLGAIGLAMAIVLPLRFAHPYWETLLFLVLQPIPIYAVGLFAYRKAPEHPTAQRLLLVGGLYGISLAFEATLGALHASRGVFEGFWLVDLAAQLVNLASLIVAIRLFALFPEGRPTRTSERVVLRLVWAFLAVPVVVLVGHPTLVFTRNVFIDVPTVASPLFVSSLSSIGSVAKGLFDGQVQLLVIGLVFLLLRFRRGSSEQRDQIKWVLYAVGLMAAVQLVGGSLRLAGLLSKHGLDAVAPYLTAPILSVTLASTVVAVLRHRLLDIDLVIRRSLLYGTLWLLIGAAYVGVAAGLGIAAGERFPVGLAILLTIAVTLLFQPLRRRLEKGAGRLVFGERLSGYQLLSRFGETLEHAFDVGELAPRIAGAVREGLDLRWARVLLQLEDDPPILLPAGASGIGLDERSAPEVVVALTHSGQRLGAIECGPKVEGRLEPGDHELLGTIARQAAMGIHNGRLAAELSERLGEIRRQAEELAASRTRIVQAQDEERRRIERNIHDGVQQEMVALMANLRLARNQLRRDPDLADQTLDQLQHEASQTLEDLRELSRGIYPPVLSDKGLVEAVESRAARMPIGASVVADPQLRALRFAPEVEGAAYFLVSEGLANVLKHAGASKAVVRVEHREGRLRVEVFDDGVGFVPADARGSGLTGLHDRIEAVGGTLRVVSSPGRGTTLVGELPAEVLRPVSDRPQEPVGG
jgi:signal transduction histidine kinase